MAASASDYEVEAGLPRDRAVQFLHWANILLDARDLSARNCSTDWQSGVLLVNLIEIACHSTIPDYHKAPKTDFHRLENVIIAVEFLRHRGLDVGGAVSPARIAQGDAEACFALLWALYTHFVDTSRRRGTTGSMAEATEGVAAAVARKMDARRPAELGSRRHSAFVVTGADGESEATPPSQTLGETRMSRWRASVDRGFMLSPSQPLPMANFMLPSPDVSPLPSMSPIQLTPDPSPKGAALPLRVQSGSAPSSPSNRRSGDSDAEEENGVAALPGTHHRSGTLVLKGFLVKARSTDEEDGARLGTAEDELQEEEEDDEDGGVVQAPEEKKAAPPQADEEHESVQHSSTSSTTRRLTRMESERLVQRSHYATMEAELFGGAVPAAAAADATASPAQTHRSKADAERAAARADYAAMEAELFGGTAEPPDTQEAAAPLSKVDAERAAARADYAAMEAELFGDSAPPPPPPPSSSSQQQQERQQKKPRELKAATGTSRLLKIAEKQQSPGLQAPALETRMRAPSAGHPQPPAIEEEDVMVDVPTTVKEAESAASASQQKKREDKQVRTNKKVHSMLQGSKKRDKVLDKLGMGASELKQFRNVPKAYQMLGVYDKSKMREADRQASASRRALSPTAGMVDPLEFRPVGDEGDGLEGMDTDALRKVLREARAQVQELKNTQRDLKLRLARRDRHIDGLARRLKAARGSVDSQADPRLSNISVATGAGAAATDEDEKDRRPLYHAFSVPGLGLDNLADMAQSRARMERHIKHASSTLSLSLSALSLEEDQHRHREELHHNKAVRHLLDSAVGRQGHLEKRRPFQRLFSKWKRRTFSLRGACLYYTKQSDGDGDGTGTGTGTGTDAGGVLNLTEFKMPRLLEKGQERNVDSTLLRFLPVESSSARAVSGTPSTSARSGTALDVRADTPLETAAWLQAITERLSIVDYIDACDEEGVVACSEVVQLLLDSAKDSIVIAHSNDLAVRVALQHFGDRLRTRPGLARISVRSSGLVDETVRMLCGVIASNNSVRSVDLSDNAIADDGALHVAKALHTNASIEAVHLNDNAGIGDVGVTAIAKILSEHSALATLTLSSTGMTDQGVEALACFFEEQQADQSSFSTLDISCNDVGDMGCKYVSRIIAANPSMASLSLRDTQISDAGLASLCDGLAKSGPAFAEIDLSVNHLTHRGLARLVHTLEKHFEQRSLSVNVSQNNIQNESLQALAKCVVPLTVSALNLVLNLNEDQEVDKKSGL